VTSPAGSQLRWTDPARPITATCPLCGNRDANAVGLEVRWAAAPDGFADVARCGECASAWFPTINPADTYPVAGGAELDADFLLLIDHYVELTCRIDWIVGVVERLPFESWNSVLEVGCNAGVLLDYIATMWGAEVVGLEPSAYGVAGARRFGRDILPEYMAGYTARTGRTFDCVVATEVIEHVADPVGFLAELRALVAPGGVALLTTPNADGLDPHRPPGEIYGALSVGAHQFLASQHQLEVMARGAGFTWVSVERVGLTNIAVLADAPVPMRSLVDPVRRAREYSALRVAGRADAAAVPRHRLADLIRLYVSSRELGLAHDAALESEIATLLRSEFAIELSDLSGFVHSVRSATDFFELGRAAPYSVPRLLYWRGQRDDLDEQTRTELWEAAVVFAAIGLALDPVNLWTLGDTLEASVTALDGRVSGRFRGDARAALGAVPEFAHLDLPDVRRSPAAAARHHVGRIARRLRTALPRSNP
jgi:SAM-dependent methyltransferase